MFSDGNIYFQEIEFHTEIPGETFFALNARNIIIESQKWMSVDFGQNIPRFLFKCKSLHDVTPLNSQDKWKKYDHIKTINFLNT